MKQYPIEDIKAPAYLFVGGSVLFIKDNIKVQKTSTRLDVATSHAIKAGDIITDQAITIKGSPVAFSNTDALFKELKLVKGARIPKIENFYIVARVAADKWIKWIIGSSAGDSSRTFPSVITDPPSSSQRSSCRAFARVSSKLYAVS